MADHPPDQSPVRYRLPLPMSKNSVHPHIPTAAVSRRDPPPADVLPSARALPETRSSLRTRALLSSNVGTVETTPCPIRPAFRLPRNNRRLVPHDTASPGPSPAASAT